MEVKQSSKRQACCLQGICNAVFSKLSLYSFNTASPLRNMLQRANTSDAIFYLAPSACAIVLYTPGLLPAPVSSVQRMSLHNLACVQVCKSQSQCGTVLHVLRFVHHSCSAGRAETSSGLVLELHASRCSTLACSELMAPSSMMLPQDWCSACTTCTQLGQCRSMMPWLA